LLLVAQQLEGRLAHHGEVHAGRSGVPSANISCCDSVVLPGPGAPAIRFEGVLSFFDAARVGPSVRYVNLSHDSLE
jgi:hypothetical protein